MARACRAVVRQVAGDAYSTAELDALLDTLEARAIARRGAGGGDPMAEAVAEVTRAELKSAFIEKRVRLAAARSKARFGDMMAKMGGDPAADFKAFMVGDDTLGHGRGYSTDAVGRALQAQLWGMVEKGLREAGLHDRLSNWLGVGDREFEARVVDEMARLNGGKEAPTGDPDAVKAAEIFNAAIELGRIKQNLEGAWIGKLDGYVVRQQHDPIKVAGGFWRELGEIGHGGLKGWDGLSAAALDRGFRKWRDFIAPRLHERTFEGVDAIAAKLDTGKLTGAADPRERFLQAVWWDIVTGRHAILKGMDEAGDFTPPPSKARSVSESRVLHFNKAADWLEYHRQYGTGSVYAAVIGDLSRAARNTALMRSFGPAPEAAFAARREALLNSAREAGDAHAGKKLAASAMEQAFDQLTGKGNAPDHLRLAHIARMVRVHQSLTKLGGMLLSSFSDTPVAAQTLARAGVDWLSAYDHVWQGVSHLGGAEQKELAELLDASAQASAAHISSRFSSADGPIGWTAGAMRLFYKVNGFEFWNEGLRAGVATGLARHLGMEAEHGWGALRQGTREWLERYGIGEREWELIRPHAGEAGGKRHLTFDAIDAVEHDDLLDHAGIKGEGRTLAAAQRVRDDLRTRLQTLVSDTLDTATSEAGARERLRVTAGTRPGTVAGELVRMFTQFWAFNFTMIGRSLGPAARGFAGQKPVALLAHLILGMTLMGYVSRQAKLLVSGHKPDAMFDPDGKPNMQIFPAAMMQGGGLGIYGDFLFGDFNRFGGSPIATLGGPTVGTAEQALKLYADLRDPDRRKDAPAEALRFAEGQTPFINIWYARAALNHALFWRMNEHISPGWAQRYEKRVDEETGSDWWLRPSEAVQ